MIERALFWWQGRTPREHRLLILLAIIAIPMAVWFAVIRPFGHALDHQRLKRDAAERMLGDVVNMAAELDRVGHRPVQTRPGLLPATVRSDAEGAGFTVSRVDGDGPDGAILVIDAARAQPFFAWIATTEQHGLIVTRLTARPNSDSTLAVSVSLRRRKM